MLTSRHRNRGKRPGGLGCWATLSDELREVGDGWVAGDNVKAPEQKSFTEAAGQSGCAGVKNRQQMAFVGKWQGLGDEERGALCSGSLCGSDRGSEPAGSGAAFWHRSADGSEDAGVFSTAGIPAEPAAGASEARPVHRDHRPDPAGG